MSLAVHAPLADRLVALGKAPDPYSPPSPSGPDWQSSPLAERGSVDVAEPGSGTVGKAHPRTFAIRTSGGGGVPVHPGIDTVRLNDSCFAGHVTQAVGVQVGQKAITFDADMIRDRGLPAEWPVVVLDPASGFMQAPAVTRTIIAGALLFGRAAS